MKTTGEKVIEIVCMARKLGLSKFEIWLNKYLSENTEKQEEAMRLAEKLSYRELAITAEGFASTGEILYELVQYRTVTESLDGVHVAPFQNVPNTLMKKIDRITINRLCECKSS
jgi:hypothetical protein